MINILELVLNGVYVENLENILTNINVLNKKNILDSHFYINDMDITFSDSIDFKKYYSVPATSMFYVKYVNVGVKISDVVVIISGVYPTVEITINFYDNLCKDDFKKIYGWMQNNIQIAFSMVFGWEPNETPDDVLYSIYNKSVN